jgi:large subunit ribosomal protein L18
MDKKTSRLRRAKKARSKIRTLGVNRLSVHRTPRHIYAQITTPDGAQVLASASSVLKDIRTEFSTTGNSETAAAVGKLLAERAKTAGITQVAFDRSGFKYHGRVKALADAARENGMEF